MSTVPEVITLAMMRQSLYCAVVSDALDSLGFRKQSPGVPLPPLTVEGLLVGRAKTTLWEEIDCEDPEPYALELAAVDGCRPDDVLVAAAGGCMRSGIWGELLSTAAQNRGCTGAIVDGAVRDVAQMRAMNFPVFARGRCVYDSLHRQRVVAVGAAVEMGGVMIHPGELIFADIDGVVVVPRQAEEEAIRRAWRKVHDENVTRDAIRSGMKAAEAYRKYGVL